MFAWQNNDPGALQLQNVEVVVENTESKLSKFDLSLEMYEEDGVVVGGMEYSTSLFDRETIQRHIGYLEAMLRWMASSTEGSFEQASILGSSERELQVHMWNATDCPYPSNVCVHTLFENQAKESPDAVAIVQDDRSLTYCELDGRADWIAQQLMATG
ncbi:hypothetical protein BGW42_000319, partial [Actinomortierella wolfii]